METTDSPPRGFAPFRRKAEVEAQEPGRVRRLARRATTKLARHRDQLGEIRDDLPVLVRLARAWARRDYRAIPWKSLVLVVGALLYFVAPMDALPDFLPGLGLVDDAAVIAYVLRSIQSDVRRFEEWEDEQKTDVSLPPASS